MAASREQYMQALKAADAAGNADDARELARRIEGLDSEATTRNENYSNEGRSRPTPVNEAAQGGTMERYWEGVKGGAARIRNEMFPPANPATLFQQDQAEAGQQVRARRAGLEHYEQTKDQLGTAGFLGDITPEVALSAMPLSRASTVASKLPLALGRYAPAVADIGVNAAYEAGKTALTGGDMSDVGAAALTGGAGAAGGRVLTRTLGGIKPLATKEAQQLIDRGVYPTPGQALGGVAASLEDKALSLPIVGDIGQMARKRSLGEYGRVEINDALRPVLSSTKTKAVTRTGAEAIEEAEKKVSSVFDSALDGMQVRPEHINTGLERVRPEIAKIPLMDAAQMGKINDFFELRIAPHMQPGSVLTGEQAKALDSELGHYARQYSRSINPGDRPLGEAFYELQSGWREAMAQGTTPDKTRLLDAANAAHKNLLPLVKASDKAMAQGGVFTPNQLQRSYGPFVQDPSRLNKAAQATLPSRVPDSGTGGRLLLGAITGAAGTAGAGLGPTAGAGALAYVMSSRQGLNLLYNGVVPTLKPELREWFMKLPSDKQAEFIVRYAKEAPSINQMAAQIGRQLATQPEEQQ